MTANKETDWQQGPQRPLLVSGAIIARHYLKQFPLQLLFAVALILLSGVLEGVGILALLPALDIVLGNSGNENQITEAFRSAFAGVGLPMTLISVVSIMVILVALKSLFLFCANVYVTHIITGLDKAYRLQMIRGLMRARWPYFTGEPIGRLANSIISEAHQASNAANALMMLASYTIQALVYLATALLVSWTLTLAGLVAGLVIMFVLRVFVQMTRHQGVRATSLNRTYHSRIIDWLHSVKPLKAMGIEERVAPFLETETHALMVTDRKLNIATQALINLQEPITTLFIAAGVVVAVQYVEVSTTALLVMVAVFARTVGRVSGIQQSLKKLARLEAPYFAFTSKLAAVEQAAEQKDEASRDKSFTPVSFNETIVFDHVSFGYDGKGVLRDFCATIEAGKITAIIGPSGAGKSTMLDLLTGLLEPEAGQILVDGVDLQQFSKRDWRRLLGYVPQETTLLHATIAENMTLGEASIAEDEIERALRTAGAWDFVSAMPDGIHSMVGERGLKVSGGQRQRLAIARALVHRPKLLLLDEATSALDKKTEQSFCAILTRLVPEVTIVAISHRPAIEEAAQVIYHLKGGHVEETRSAPVGQVAAGAAVSGAE